MLYPVDIISQSLFISERVRNFFNLFFNKETGILVSGLFNICLATLHLFDTRKDHFVEVC